MKKLIIGIVAAAVLVSLVAACASKPTPATSPAPAPTTSAPTTAAPAPAAQPIVLRGDSLLAQNHDLTGIMMERLKEIEKRTGGRIMFDVSYGAVLTSTKDGLDTTGKGTVDWVFAAPTWYTGMDARFEIVSLPFAAKDMADYLKMLETTPMGGLIESASNKFNTHFVGFTATPASVTLTKKTAVRKLEDMKGLKIRSPGGSQMEALKKLGAIPVDVVAAEFYSAVEKGIVDGVWLSYLALDNYKLVDLVKYINTIEICPVINGLYFNLDVWKKLPADIQSTIQEVYTTMQPGVVAAADQSRAKYSDMARKASIELITPDAAETARWVQTAGLPVWEITASRMGADGQVFLKTLKDWNGIK